jgi:hypothetical protein
MSQSDSQIERTLHKILAETTIQPATLPPLTIPPTDHVPSAYSAVALCRDAWQQAYDAYMQRKGRRAPNEYEAQKEAAAAYRAAMPQCATWAGIRNFIACVAYGVLIEAIPEQRTGQLLYAAQVALSILPRIPSE